MSQLTREVLEKLLREAEAAHAEYEKQIGRRDENWPKWYADYIMARLDASEG